MKTKFAAASAADVTGLLKEGKFLVEMWLDLLHEVHFVTVRTTFCKSAVARGSADHDFKFARLDDVFHIDVVKRQ